MVTRRDYDQESVEAARSVMIEVVHLLGAYRDRMVLIGGWVPALLVETPENRHSGSMDIDLALDHTSIGEADYRTIGDLLLSRGYRSGKQPFIYLRDVNAGARTITVEVDLLAGEYGGTNAKHRTQRVQDVLVRKARGADLAFDSPRVVTISATLPGGASDSVEVRVVPIPAFIAMKGFAIASRMKEKDAYDVWFCLKFYAGGLDALAEEMRGRRRSRLFRDGLLHLASKFTSPNDWGPRSVADYFELPDDEERAVLQRDMFEIVSYMMRSLGIGAH